MIKIIMVFLAMYSFTAFAGNQQHGGMKKKDRGLNHLIKMCDRFAKNPQIKPFSAEINCRGSRTFWSHIETKDASMNTEILVRAEVAMKGDRYKVNEITTVTNGRPGVSQCNVYSEYRQDFTAVTLKINSCDDLRELKKVGRLNYCLSQLKNSPDSGDPVATGRKSNTCGT